MIREISRCGAGKSIESDPVDAWCPGLNRRRLIAGCGTIALASWAPFVYGCRLFPPDSTDHYLATQDGRAAGFQSISFFHAAAEFVVSTQRRFQYLNGAGDRIDYSHSAREFWSDGRLQRFESTTRHGDRHSRVTAETVDHVTMLVRSTESRLPSLVTGYVVPGNLWHRDARLVSRLMDLSDGRLKLVNVARVGEDIRSVAGITRTTQHYRFRGEMNLDAWYTEDCQLARVLLPFRTAAPVVFELG